MVTARIGILTSSDRASAGVYEDLSGAAIREVLTRYLTSPWEAVYRVVPDDRATLEAELVRMIDVEGCCLVVTTGGTGPALRDVTPEATEAVCHKKMPGFGEQMRAVSLKSVPTAILSRQTAGIRERPAHAPGRPQGVGALVVNLPGKPAAIEECLGAVFPAIPYCIDLLEGPRLEGNPEVVKVFRPKR